MERSLFSTLPGMQVNWITLVLSASRMGYYSWWEMCKQMKYSDSLYNKRLVRLSLKHLVQPLYKGSFWCVSVQVFSKLNHLSGHAGGIWAQWCFYGGIKTDSLALVENIVNQIELLRESFLLCVNLCQTLVKNFLTHCHFKKWDSKGIRCENTVK